MSVLVKGMEIPKSCGECPLDYDSIACRATNKEFPNRSSDDGFDAYCNTRMPDCPLVEVPTTHGRLIDADKIRYHSGTWEKGFDWVMQSEIALTPTIIPADKDGGDVK